MACLGCEEPCTVQMNCTLRSRDGVVKISRLAEAWKDNVSYTLALHVQSLDLVVGGLFSCQWWWYSASRETGGHWPCPADHSFPTSDQYGNMCLDAHLSDWPAWVWSQGCVLLSCVFSFLLDDDKCLQTGTVQVGESPGLSRSASVNVLSEHDGQVNQTARGSTRELATTKFCHLLGYC